ncbi:hypothetical protein ABZ630_32015, partial [Streptomyces albidoflavus]|uniref:hypothetical protein n=1 Tax=Streptomyces albidoflavus TaxID=1886 RepID=UPI0033ED7371
GHLIVAERREPDADAPFRAENLPDVSSINPVLARGTDGAAPGGEAAREARHSTRTWRDPGSAIA